MYEKFLARSFSRYEQKKLGYGALVASLLIALTFCTVFKPYLSPLQVLNLRLSMGVGLKMLMIKDTSRSPSIEIEAKKMDQPVCNFMEQRTDFCEARGDIRVSGKSSTVFIIDSSQRGLSEGNSSWEIRPYARKRDSMAMSLVRKWSVKSAEKFHQEMIPRCTQNHSVPAILFSAGGYAGNHFHDFTDVVIPLFITTRKFKGEVQFLITDERSFWINKYRLILKGLSNYEIIKIDREEGIHCFPSVIVGLKSYRELNFDPSKSPYSMKDFRTFLRSSYSLNRSSAIKLKVGESKRPRLLIISRKISRSFTNGGEIAEMARTLGYDVVVVEADIKTKISEFARIVNSCDVLMGVHGAGLTNIVFLPDNAIFIQVVPLGRLEWLSRRYFGEPAKDMKLKYLEYGIEANESSLIEQYPIDHEVFKDPYAIQNQGWLAFRSVYMDKQNVKLNANRFRPILLEALELLHDQKRLI